MPGETLGIGALAAVWGAREFYRRGNRPPGGSGPQSNRDLVAVLGGAYLFYVIVFHALSNLPVEVGVFHEMLTRFWQLPNTLLFAGMGLALAAFSDRARFWTWRPWVTPAATVFLVALQLGLHYRQEDQSQNQVVRDYAVSHLIAVSPHALVITKGDIVTNGIRYLQAVEGMRPDVCNFDQGILGLTWGSGLIRKNCPQIAVPPFGTGSPAQIASSILDANLDRFPTYAGSFVLNDGTRSCGAGLSCWGEGLMYRVLRENQAPDYLAYIQADRQAIAAVDLARLSAAEARDGWAETIARYYRDSRYRVGYSMIQKGLSLGAAPLIDEGVRLLEAITAEWPAVPADAYKVLGFGLRAQASRNANAQAKMVRALKTYLGRPEAAQDPQRAALLALVGQGT